MVHLKHMTVKLKVAVKVAEHLKGHIVTGIRVNCPAQGCGQLMGKKSIFTAWMSSGCLSAGYTGP